jgi:hypothetical protein
MAGEIKRAQECRALYLLTYTAHARLWKRQGHGEAARATLAEIYRSFTEGFSSPDLVDAQTLLDSLA